MFSNRLCQSFSLAHLRRGAVSIYFHNYHSNFNLKHNLSPVNKRGLNILASSKCSTFFINSVCSPVRQYSDDSVPDSVGTVNLLRGFRKDVANELTVSSPFECGHCIYRLTKLLKQDSVRAIYDFNSGFEQAFGVYLKLLCERNTDDLDRDWLQPTAQEDSKDIINRLPENCWDVLRNPGYLIPFCLGYKVLREETPPSVDAAILIPCVLTFWGKKLLWHLVFTRKFGEGVTDSWSIKNVAVYIA